MTETIPQLCPRCAGYMMPPRWALSRVHDGVHICSDCGKQEMSDRSWTVIDVSEILEEYENRIDKLEREVMDEQDINLDLQYSLKKRQNDTLMLEREVRKLQKQLIATQNVVALALEQAARSDKEKERVLKQLIGLPTADWTEGSEK